MAKTSVLNILSSENEIILNPKWPANIYQSLFKTATVAQERWGLTEHVWIATSGSTALNSESTKLVALSKKALGASAAAVNRHLQAVPGETWIQVLPSFHVGGLGIDVRAQLSQSQVVSGLKGEQWDALYFYDTVVQTNANLAALVPTQIFDLVITLKLKSPASLRAVVIGGGALSENLYQAARNLGWPVLPSYGMTETASQIATARLESLQSFDYPNLTLLDHAQARRTGDGFLEVKAESLFTCYARKHSETDIEVWDPKCAGWFQTEDKGQVQDQNLIIEGRHQDYIKIGAEASNVALLRSTLESLLAKHHPEWVAKVALIDITSERLGSEVHMATTLEMNEAQIVQDLFVKAVRPFEKIRRVYFLSHIPRSDLGKIKWGELRSLCEARK